MQESVLEINIEFHTGKYLYFTDNKPFRGLVDKDKILTYKDYINVVIDYPLKYETIVTVKSSDKKLGFTLEDLLDGICTAYQNIYKIERETSDIKEETIGEYNKRMRNGRNYVLTNRVPTNGKYKIRYHVIEDLVLDTITYNSNKDLCTLCVSS